MKAQAFLLSALCALASFAGPVRLSVVNDHTNLLYRVGEEVSFTVTAKSGDALATNGFVDVTLDNCGPATQLSNRVDLAKGNPFVVKGRLDEPGFLRLTVRQKPGEPWPFVWSVGVEPTRIAKGSPSPDDFDAFWAAARAKLAKEVPLDAQVTRVAERSTADFDFFRVSFATFGRRVYGCLSVPTDKAKAPYPVEIQVSAAGFGSWTNTMEGEPGIIKAFFAVYPWAPDRNWQLLGLRAAYDYMNEAYAARWGEKVEYSAAGIAKSREDYFFYPVLLGIDRAVDWIAARPDADKTRFWYQGTSQGGGFGFYLTGLNRHFTRATFFVPAITDTMGYLKGRPSGWPRIVERQREENKEATVRFAPYFDGANFASRITCPVRVAVGFADTTCPPCAVYAAYNEIKAEDKGIVHGFGMSHSCFDWIYAELDSWRRK